MNELIYILEALIGLNIQEPINFWKTDFIFNTHISTLPKIP